MINIDHYSSLVFDCDGVLLNSNRIKTEAFRIAAQPWGDEAAEALVAHHVANGGISRHQKFKYFFDSILPEYSPAAVPGFNGPGLDELLATYAQSIRVGLLTCSVAEGLADLRSYTSNAKWIIVSGGDQLELREIFAMRGLEHFFDGGIFGSPDNKDVILTRELETRVILKPALFLGDSIYDYESAKKADIDFVFVSDWSDVQNWQSFIRANNLKHIKSISDIAANN